MSDLPLPKIIPDVEQGGGVVSSMRGINALTASNLANRMKQLQNQYYAPNIESEIGYRNALAKGQGITNEYLPEKLRIANALAQQENDLYTPKTQSEMNYRNALTQRNVQTLPLDIENQKNINEWYGRDQQAKIDAAKSLSQYREMGGANASVNQKDINALQRQIMTDNPGMDGVTANQVASAALAGEDTLSNGQPVPELSGLAQTQIAQIQKRNSTAAIQNQAANLDVLVDELKSLDIEAIKSFTGPKGKAKLAYAQAKMATNPDDPSIDPMARRFLASMKQTIINMDAMRKSFGTSVVPDYVYKTIGKLTNPNDSIWNDPTQVAQNYKAVTDSISKTRNTIMAKATRGISAKSKENTNEKPNYEYEGQLPPKGMRWMITPKGNKEAVLEENVPIASAPPYNYRNVT